MGLFGPRETPAPADWVEPPALGLVASAARVEIKQTAKTRKRPTQQDWQEEAWHHYNRCGELQYAAAWMANSLSRIRLFAAEIGEDGRPGGPTDNPIAQRIATELFGGPGAAAQVLAALGVHLTIPGDSYIVCEENQATGSDDWYVVSTSELEKKGGKLGIDRGAGFRALDPEKAVLIRVWNPHPQKREEATSPTRAMLPVLREMEKYDSHVIATLESRLAGAGVMFVPDNISFKASDPEAAAAGQGVNQFMDLLTDAMVTAVDDADSPARLVPIVAGVPADALAGIQHITFGTELTAAIKEGREECIRRLSIGMDMPPEALLGQGDSNHWSAWQIEEGGIKVHVEPKAITICSALTESYFRPALKAAGIDNPEDYVLWYDVTDLVLRPNRADAAKALHEADALSDEVMLREAGFDPEEDAPKKDERDRRLLVKLLLARPELIDVLLPALGIKLPEPAPQAPPLRRDEAAGPAGPQIPAPRRSPTGETPPGTGSETAIPSTEPRGDAGTPAQAQGDTAPVFTLAARAPAFTAQEIAVEQLVSRGLEFAGKRLLTRDRRGKYGDVDVRAMYRQPGVTVVAGDIARLLDGAWAYLPEVAEQVGLDPARLQAHLNDHVGGLLTTGQPHAAQYSRTIVRLAA